MTELEQDVLQDTLVSAHDTVLTPPPSPCRDDSRESTDDEAVFDWFYDSKPLQYSSPASL